MRSRLTYAGYFAIALVVILVVWLFLNRSPENQGSKSQAAASSNSGAAKDKLRPTGTLSERASRARQSPSDSGAALQAIYARWDKAKNNLTGQALLDERKQIARDAILELGDSDAFLQFLDLLKKEGQGDLREWVLTEGLAELFASEEKAEDARKWLLEIKDEKVQEAMCFAAGQGFRGPGFKQYLDSFGSIHSQSRLLGGYFAKMAEHDPEAAVKGFIANKPAKVDFTALKHVMAAVPTGSDFVGISAMVPGDGQSLAKSARRSLIGAWAKSAPQEAADYILSNSKLVHADQLGPVIEQWMISDPASAETWIQGLAPGEHRDIATATQAKAGAK